MRGGLRLALLSAALACAGCAERPEPPAPPASVRRIACASPAAAEIVFALGAGALVVGVADFTDWPPEAAALPRIGGALAPSRETLLALKPDLIVAQGRAEPLAAFARAHRIAMASPALDTLGDLRAAIALLADALGAQERGRELLAELDAALSAPPPCGPVRVFIALAHAPGDFSGLMTSGAGTFLHELVERAGGSNAFADVGAPWPRVSRESIVRRAPTLILDFQPGGLDDARRAALVADWVALGFRPEQVRLLEEDYLLRPGPRAVQSLARIARAICP